MAWRTAHLPAGEPACLPMGHCPHRMHCARSLVPRIRRPVADYTHDALRARDAEGRCAHYLAAAEHQPVRPERQPHDCPEWLQ